MKNNLALRIKSIASALCGVIDAVIESPHEPENYYDGLFYLSFELLTLSNKLCGELEKEALVSDANQAEQTREP